MHPDASDAGMESDGDENAQAANDGRETRFVSWQELERVADEAADIDAVVRGELEAVGERRAIEDGPFAVRTRPPRRRRRWVGATFVGALVVIALSAAFVLVRSTGGLPRTRPISSISPQGSPTVPTTTPSPSRSPSPPAGGPVRAIVARLSFSAPCWVDAVADGRTVFVGTVADGSRTIRAERTLLLTLGNAGGVDVLVDGRRVGTAGTGQVVHLSFVLKDGKVVQLTD